MSDIKNVDNSSGIEPEAPDPHVAVPPGEVSSTGGSVTTAKTQSRVSSSSERQIKFERAQKCLENAALVSKRIKEHRKATAELLGRPFEEDEGGDTASELASTMSERTGYSAATDTSTTLSVQDALNIPGISESLANTLKQKELLMERIKQYKEISKRPMKTTAVTRRDSVSSTRDTKTTKEPTDVIQLLNTIKEKENALSIIQVKMKAMETTILDLQEKINEKDQIIEAKNKATTLMSDSLSKKEKDSVLLLEDTRQQMIKMQENFISMEAEWKTEKENLIKSIEEKDEKICHLEEANKILENSRFEAAVTNSKLTDEIESKQKEIDAKQNEIAELMQKIENLSHAAADQQLSQKEKQDTEEEKGSLEIANMVELTKKVELLEQLNCQIRQTNKELENKLASVNTESKTPATGSPSKKGSPLPTRKGGRNTASKMKSPWSNISSESLNQEPEKKSTKNEVNKLELVVQSLNKEILEKEYIISQKDNMIVELQNTKAQNETEINELKLRSVKHSDVVDVGISTDIIEVNSDLETKKHVSEVDMTPFEVTDTKDLEEKLKGALEQIAALNSEIDASNKNMIKVKSNHKLKLKQMQKTIDNFSKVSDANAEIIKLNEELHQLSQKVAELEEEKGNLQLHLVDYDSGRLTESEVYKKLIEVENLAETRLQAITLLETQKFDLVQELHELQQKYDEIEDKLADISQLQCDQVSSEIKSVQLEEQIDNLVAAKEELQVVNQNLKLNKDQLEATIKALDEEKEELIHRLEHYIQENMELTDRLDKMSAEKVSSAESIEIVESLTTQEKLELEEYNKRLSENKLQDIHEDLPVLQESDESIETLKEQSAELNRKIELFTQEREEVMEKMSKISCDNETLLSNISELKDQSATFQNSIEILNRERDELLTLNEELNRQIANLKQEQIDIMKDSVEISKPASIDEVPEGSTVETQDDKTTSDKGNGRTKSVKQLTKEILKLKNTIKEREAEIGDCQMKILALEEHQQKQNELMQNVSAFETKIKSLTEENSHLKGELEISKHNKESEQQLLHFQQSNEYLQQELRKLHQEYSNTINIRDAKIRELESILLEYEKQIYNYGNTLQQKDKELAEYTNQITKLNDVSQKLKSTIEVLEEEKAKDQNAELVKSLNKQIMVYQKKLSECEEKISILEEEKSQLLSLKDSLESKNMKLESELKKLQEAYADKQNLIKDLQSQQSKHIEEMSNVMLQVKERDEEIHEVKLQLRKESIENEKLRNALSERESNSDQFMHVIEENKMKFEKLTKDNEKLLEELATMETKNKELMEKLKKFAASVKKKSSMYTELENHLHETEKILQNKNEQLEQLTIQVDALPALQEKLKYAEEELQRLQSQKINIEQQNSNNVTQLENEIKSLQEKLSTALNEVLALKESQSSILNDSKLIDEENKKLRLQVDTLSNKLADNEVEQKNSTNLITKVTSLEGELNLKNYQVNELLTKLESHEQKLTQLEFGLDAKVQERDLYIESLQGEINKYQARIGRLEESISIMEDSRHTLERKADQLDSQLQEKQKAYDEYASQEDSLVSRLANLMDHDRVVEKQLHEIDSENKELQYKLQHYTEENQRLRKSLSDIQEYCNTLVDKANRADFSEAETAKLQTELRDLDAQLKRITHEHHVLITQKKHDIEELESEFNTQIESAIKEKKILSEKYEKVAEHVTELEQKLSNYRSNIDNLNVNIEELTRINHQLVENSNKNEPVSSPDYTEQYINEINKLNSITTSKNQEIGDLHTKIQNMQSNSLSLASNFESKIAELSSQLQSSYAQIQHLTQEWESMKVYNEQLQVALSERDQQIQQLMQKKTVTFEMNIPKTEGMFISSTIEPLQDDKKQVDFSALESQILPESSEVVVEPAHVKKVHKSEKQTSGTGGVVEEVIVPKKTYLCYKGDEEPVQVEDPFNSDEGWGLGECAEVSGATPGITHLTEQIKQLQKDNDSLKADLQASNNKLSKALKKLKELKSNNDILTNELKTTKQLSQTSFLDSAIEDEMKINIEQLEKKIEDLTTELGKEKREKDSIRKQNEVFSNANDRLTEMKEKMDNEIELWKYKFKEANDKLSSMQWSSDTTDSPGYQVRSEAAVGHRESSQEATKDELIKMEKELTTLENENDELQSAVNQLTSQNKDLSQQLQKLQVELDENNKKLQTQSSHESEWSENLNKITELQNINAELLTNYQNVCDKLNALEIRHAEVVQEYDRLKLDKDDAIKAYDLKNKELLDQNRVIQEEITRLKEFEIKSQHLMSELEAAQTKIVWLENQKNADNKQDSDAMVLSEKLMSTENYCSEIKHNLDEANDKILKLESENHELLEKVKGYETERAELKAKVEQLNTENDQLLCTVTELRSSISSAVDQRGYEIAEIWKQHLAQRETDFVQTEQELRAQLNAAEAKYEQLLDNVQSSTQEETNKLVFMEQITSLQNKLQDKEGHILNLQDKYAEVVSHLDMLRSEIEDEKVLLENKLLAQQEEYEKQTQELIVKNQQHSEEYEEAYKNVQVDLAASKANIDELRQENNELKDKIAELETTISDLNVQLRMKESEIYQKTHDLTVTFNQRTEEFDHVRKQLLDYEKKIEDLSYEKEAELAILRLKMHENDEHNNKLHSDSESEKVLLAESLNAKIVECTNLSKQIADLNKTIEEQSTNIAEMQAALENQELELVTLKDEMSNMLATSSRIEKHVTFASDTKPGPDTEPEIPARELLDPVPRAELDLALYMLHQRDVRCEELTMELTQLLEERDTLQLRLSDSLRSYEELKSSRAGTESGVDTVAELPVFSADKDESVDVHRAGPASRSSSIGDPDAEKPKLQAKLSELRSVRHSRDVRLRRQSEARQLDLRLLQQDIAHLPPEAVQQLTQAHHTLSRDSQSTSTVLLNWLRGKSTPKIVHDM